MKSFFEIEAAILNNEIIKEAVFEIGNRVYTVDTSDIRAVHNALSVCKAAINSCQARIIDNKRRLQNFNANADKINIRIDELSNDLKKLKEDYNRIEYAYNSLGGDRAYQASFARAKISNKKKT